MGKASRNKAIRKSRSIDSIISEMSPKQVAGLEIGGEAVDSAYSPDAKQKDASDLIRHMADAEFGRGSQGVRFVAEDDPEEFWSMGDDRIVGGADKTFTQSAVQAMQAGFICIRCHEVHDEAFPIACSLCGYSMKELQVRDFALEFQGGKHLGPSKPISEHMEEMQERLLKDRFERKIKAGASRMKGLRGAGA